ncbi:hypothetical protein ACCO45_013285 [Purpureocillium lilacinum]|uniref:Uncharacterized protein n=1 Tax=Purpureocillium lilacinum TaxID=33203 RepID=A0ACC4DBY2_PURLI
MILADELGERPEEKSNPLLQYAWQRFDDYEGDSVSEAVLKQRADVKADVIKALMAADKGLQVKSLSFEALMDCGLMQQAVWSKGLYRRLRNPLTKDAHGVFKESKPLPMNVIIKSNVLLVTTSSLVAQHGGPDGALASMILSKFGYIQELDIYMRNDRPLITMIRLIASPEHGFGVRHLMTFKSPCDIFDPYNGNTFREDVWRIQYNIMAIVRLRHEGESSDAVRRFRMDGKELRPRHTDNAAFSNTEWDICDDGKPREYIIFYCFQAAMERLSDGRIGRCPGRREMEVLTPTKGQRAQPREVQGDVDQETLEGGRHTPVTAPKKLAPANDKPAQAPQQQTSKSAAGVLAPSVSTRPAQEDRHDTATATTSMSGPGRNVVTPGLTRQPPRGSRYQATGSNAIPLPHGKEKCPWLHSDARAKGLQEWRRVVALALERSSEEDKAHI